MSDWTGSEQQRKRTETVYPGAKPTPSKPVYIVKRGTKAMVKRVGDKAFEPCVVRKDAQFDSVYSNTAQSMQFFRVGFILSVFNDDVEIRPG